MVKRAEGKKKMISVIIPAYKQEKTIVKDILRIKKVLSQLRYNFEMIVVVDGMVDKTFEHAKKLSSKLIRVYGYQKNHGKGFALRYGMSLSKGDIIGFIDSGMDLNPNGLSMLLEHFEWYGADIIIGSKRHPVSKIKYPIDRKLVSYTSQILIKVLFGLNVRDTQVGMKFFKRNVIEKVLPRLIVKQYAFDIEILTVAHNLGFQRIFEAPVEIKWNSRSGITTGNLWKVLILTFFDTCAIFYRLKIRNYYHDRRRWKINQDTLLKMHVG